MAHDVFLSYTTKDRTVAEAVYSGIERGGIRCWVAPRDVMPGQDFGESIVGAIASSRVFVLILSESANASPQVRRELERATSVGLPILPFRIDDSSPGPSLTYFLGSVHWIDASRPPLEGHIAKLADVVHRLVGGRDRPGLPAADPSPVVSEEERFLASLYVRSLSEMSEVAKGLAGAARSSRFSGQSRAIPGAIVRLDRASRHVGKYFALDNPARRLDALDAAMRELAELQIALVDEPAGMGERLLDVVGSWREILEQERRKIEQEADRTREIPNPFVFGNPVTELNGSLFTGRRDIARQIEQAILCTSQAPTLLLHGERRMGKTSILNQLSRLLGPGFLPVFIDCQNPAAIGGPAALLRYIARAIAGTLNRRLFLAGDGPATRLDAGLLSRLAGVLRRAIGALSDRGPAADRGRHGTMEPPSASALGADPYRVFDEWLDDVGRALPAGTRLLLCIDEYERLQEALDGGWGCHALDAMRHWIQHREFMVLMFTGSRTFEELGPRWTDRFISARRVKVSFLRAEEVRDLLTAPVPGFNMTYAPGSLEALQASTGGQPFLTQAVAFELVQHLNQANRREATREDVEVAIERALASGGEYFANLWSSIGSGAQALLRELASGHPVPPMPAERSWLCQHDILDAAARFAVPMVGRWIVARKVGPAD